MMQNVNDDSASPVAIVTGAGRGIGAETARLLSENGIRVACADIPPVSLPEGLVGEGHFVHAVDVRVQESCDALLYAVMEHYGRVDYLVNNAGIVRRGAAIDMSNEDFLQVFDVNTMGAFRMSKAAYPALKINGGSIVNLGSTNGSIAVKNTIGYCVSKAAVMHLGKVLALEWAADGIRVNSVGPTIVSTDMTSDIRRDSEYVAEKLATIPLGRMATPRDVAQSIYFLLSPLSSMVTGHTIFVDGGVLTQ